MFKSVSLLLFSALLFALIFPSSTILAQAESGNKEMVDIIVRYEDTVPNEEELDSSYKNVQTLDILPIQTMTVPKSAVKKISSQKNVKRVTYDQLMTTSDSSRTFSETDWNKDLINAFDAWDEGYTGEGISVAVIDTGFYQHSDINYAGGHSIFGEEVDPWTSDTEGHGTHVAGVIAASPESPARGVAPGVSVYGVKVYPSKEGNSTSASNLLKGIQWAVKKGVNIINISSGYEVANQDIYEVIQKAVNSGILVIAASGNSNDSNNDIDYPAAHPEVIAVSNVDSSSHVADDSMVSGLNELAAPGVGILGLDNAPGEYVSYSGTSQATPHVAGIAAILMQRYKGVLSSGEIRFQLQQEALDLGTEGFDSLYGHGLVQYVPKVVKDTTDEEADSSEEVNPPEENLEDNDGETDTETPVSVPGEEEQEVPAEEDQTIEAPVEVNPEPEEPVSNESQTVDVLQNAVWIRPESSEGSAIISSEDLNAVADNGTLAISFDYTMDDLDQLNLTEEQVSEIRQRNISILIAKPDIEWLIPATNFQQGTATARFTKTLGTEPAQKELAKSSLYQFEFFVNGEPVQSFEENMIYRFFTDFSEANQDKLYIWNVEQNDWQEFGDTYSNGALIGTTNQTGIVGVLNPSALDGTIEKEETEDPEEKEDETNTEEDAEPKTESEDAPKSEEDVADEEVSATESNSDPTENSEDQEQETETTRNGISDSSAISPPMVAGAAVILLSFGGGFYYFGGKSKL